MTFNRENVPKEMLEFLISLFMFSPLFFTVHVVVHKVGSETLLNKYTILYFYLDYPNIYYMIMAHALSV